MNQLIEIQLFGPISSFAGIYNIKNIELEQCESYQKMGYRNRFQILSAGGVLNLSVPLVGGRDQKRPTWAMEVDYTGRWQKEHWRTLESNYNRSPFFEFYAPSLKLVWDGKPIHLADFCIETLQWTLKQLKWNGTITLSNSFVKEALPGTLDARNHFLPKNRLTYLMPEYQQQFGIRFEQNLSILDLLFNFGPMATDYLNKLEFPFNFSAEN
jgi:hypothetical protein